MSTITLLLGTLCAFAGQSGQIAFVTGLEQEDQRVCVLDLDSGAVTAIGTGNRDGAPVWSPDGQWIAFETPSADGGTEIALVRNDGTTSRRIKHAASWNHWPAWSPDGRLLAYSGGDGLEQRIYVADAASGTEERWGSDNTHLLRPQWTADGRIIAIGLVGEPGNYTTDLYWVTQSEATAGHELKASDGPYTEWAQAYDLKNRQIAYESNDGGDREIFVFIPKYGALDVSNHRSADWNPVWAPDGSWLAFESFRNGRRGIYRVTPLRQLVSPIAANEQWDDWAPAWSPDGEWLAFISNRTGSPRLFVCSASGDEVRPLTDHATSDFAPAWRPQPVEKP